MAIAPKMFQRLTTHDHKVDLAFPMFVDSDIGLSSKNQYTNLFDNHYAENGQGNATGDIVQDHEIEQEMDDDVQTDSGIMWNAKNTCINDIHNARQELGSRPFADVCHNKEILLRVRFHQQYTRAGRFKEYYDGGNAESGENPLQDLARGIREEFHRQRHRRYNSMTRFETTKHENARASQHDQLLYA